MKTLAIVAVVLFLMSRKKATAGAATASTSSGGAPASGLPVKQVGNTVGGFWQIIASGSGAPVDFMGDKLSGGTIVRNLETGVVVTV